MNGKIATYMLKLEAKRAGSFKIENHNLIIDYQGERSHNENFYKYNGKNGFIGFGEKGMILYKNGVYFPQEIGLIASLEEAIDEITAEKISKKIESFRVETKLLVVVPKRIREILASNYYSTNYNDFFAGDEGVLIVDKYFTLRFAPKGVKAMFFDTPMNLINWRKMPIIKTKL